MIVTIDTGGTKTLISSFNSQGKMGESIKFPTPKDTKEYVKILTQTIQENFLHENVEVIVLALPGIVKDGIAVWCNNLGWQNFAAHQQLKDALPGVPFLVENDANLAGLAETRALNPVPISSLYITISTGIGSGICTNGHIDPGTRYSEAGRALIEYDGKVREWEKFASGHAIVDIYKQFARDITSKRTWRQIADRISRGFLAVIPILQPDVIIIGGSVGTYFDRYHEYLEGILKEHLPPHIPCPKIVQAQHPEEAVIYGCYYHGKDFLADKKISGR
ncbi:ROK family protein [Candidatus Saccharibacteria bacterium]|nr:ROK family protein [Candidatus Saccharibacteria bacterium]